MGSVNEEWRAVAGFEGLYQVSSLGRVKSVERTVAVNGRQQKAKTILRPTIRLDSLMLLNRQKLLRQEST